MDRAKNLAKGVPHPHVGSGAHRKAWKSDLKGIATGKKDDPRQNALDHQSAPLGSLKDPDGFGPPPKHMAASPISPTSSSGLPPARSGSGSSAPTTPRKPPPGGLGGSVPRPVRQEQEEEEKPKPPPVPYRTDTSGLSTQNLPKPPVRRVEPGPPVAASRTPAPPARPPAPPARSPAPPVQPARPQQHPQAAMPNLPPRMNEHPDEFTPAPPPSYPEATQASTQDPAAINNSTVQRLSQAGVSVPGFGIGGGTNAPSSQPLASQVGHGGQLPELQQRFARMNPGSSNQLEQPAAASSASSTGIAAAVASQKKPPPPPPPKKAGLGSGSRPGTEDGSNAPPPIPMSSKPRPS